MVADKGKKSKVNPPAEEDDSSEQIDGELVLSIEKLQEVQDELEKLNEEASDKVLEVEQKYNEIRKPIYDRRSEVIQMIPDFWLTAFLSHPALSDLLSEEDHKIFKHLQSLDVSDSKDVKSGYSITLNFRPNPYFENTKLTKTFTFDDEGNASFTGTDIKWKDGTDIPNGTSHEDKGNKRPFSEESFFMWFSDSQRKDIPELIHDEVGDIIKEDLWTNPLKYFNNEGDEDDFDEEDDDDENEQNGNVKDDSDDDEDDDEEDDDDDDEEDDS